MMILKLIGILYIYIYIYIFPIPNLVGDSIFTLRPVHSAKAYFLNGCEKQIVMGACAHKGEWVIVSMSKPTLRAVLNGHTFRLDLLSTSTIETLASMHSIVICKDLVWVIPSGVSSSLEKVREKWDTASTPIMAKLLEALSLYVPFFQTMHLVLQLSLFKRPFAIPKRTRELESSSFGLKPCLPFFLHSHFVQWVSFLLLSSYRDGPSLRKIGL